MGKALTQRQLRIGEVLRHALAEVFLRGEIVDPALDGVSITVPEVRVSADLSLAVCYVIPLGGEKTICGETVVKIMARHAAFLRGAVARRVRMRRMPRFCFRFDTSFDEGEKVSRLLG